MAPATKELFRMTEPSSTPHRALPSGRQRFTPHPGIIGQGSPRLLPLDDSWVRSTPSSEALRRLADMLKLNRTVFLPSELLRNPMQERALRESDEISPADGEGRA